MASTGAWALHNKIVNNLAECVRFKKHNAPCMVTAAAHAATGTRNIAPQTCRQAAHHSLDGSATQAAELRAACAAPAYKPANTNFYRVRD